MSPENLNTPAKSKDETRKTGQNRSSSNQQQQQDQPHINCPRCDSANTKFCYYNNYSLTQPRHFCKTCRRYWTKGGALRNVPIGGGCRKAKKTNKSSSSSSSTSRLAVFGDHFSSVESSDQIGLKFFHGGNNNNSNISPAVDFQLGSSSLSLVPRLQYPSQNSIFTQFSISPNSTNASVGASSVDPIGSSLMGLNFPLKPHGDIGMGGDGGCSDSIHQSMNVHTNIASSIESLSCMNQDLHWKLQQQRLATLFEGGGGGGGGGGCGGLDHVDDHHQSKIGNNLFETQSQKLQPILFQNLEISKKDVPSGGLGGSGDMATEWFFDSTTYHNAPINSGGTRNLVQDQSREKYDGAYGNDHEDHSTTNWNNGIQAWNDLHQFSSNLP